MALSFGERSTRDIAGRLVGRRTELDQLSALLGDGPPYITFVRGVAGVGKTSLLAAFSAESRAAGAIVVPLDCRALEPTDRGVIEALSAALGLRSRSLPAIVRRLSRLPGRTIIQFDHYEVLRLADTWLRQIFVPQLPANVRVLIAGREPPVAAWIAALQTGAGTDLLALGPLPQDDAIHLLIDLGVPESNAKHLNRVLRGHPLAIRLAAVVAAERPDLGIDDLAAQTVVHELSRLFLVDVRDPITREALEAVSVVRRTTSSLLAVLVPDVPPQDVIARLRALSFVEIRQDGLGLHDAVQASLATYVRSTDPVRYRRYRRAAWRQLREEIAQAQEGDLWRYTADMLYLIENPIVREAFFPSGAQPLAVEPATSRDLDAIETIARRHDGEQGAEAILAWYRAAPRSFSAIRDRDGLTVAFFCLFDRHTLMTARVDDPVVEGWRRHLRRTPPQPGQEVLGFRRWLDFEHGERPSSSQAASWLDVKRTYMLLRPRLRRIYTVVEGCATKT